MATTSDSPAALSTEGAWSILLALADRAKAGKAVCTARALRCQDGEVEFDVGTAVTLHVDFDAPNLWSLPEGAEPADAEVEKMLNLYMPLCVGEGANSMVLGHLGQSLDGRIATQSGVSQFITGEENIVHTHRLRALFDVVLVGANTASHDNPKLTTRHVPGDHATRVLVDPQCSVDPEASIFTDGLARTLVICESAFAPEDHAQTHIALDAEDGSIAPSAIIAALNMLGLRRLFVEGGGVTISKFLQAGELDRLHLCIAPMIIGSGRPAFRLPEVTSLDQCVFLDVRHFVSGADILYDCQLRPVE